MRSLIILIAGLGLAYQAFAVGDTFSALVAVWSVGWWALTLIGIGLVAFFLVTGFITLFDERTPLPRLGASFVALIMFVTIFGAGVYGIHVRPITMSGPEPWKWFGSHILQDAALAAIALLPIILFILLIAEGLAKLKTAMKRGDPYVNNTLRVYAQLHKIESEILPKVLETVAKLRDEVTTLAKRLPPPPPQAVLPEETSGRKVA